MAEKDPAKQTPDGQSKRPGTRSSTPTADSSKSSGRSGGSSKTGVQVSLDKVQTDVLDNLRDATTRHDYVQRIVERHLEAANPNATFQPDDDLPGNEREVRRPNLRV